MKFVDEINRRRTFAIISHPDAGKTTLTEKLLLFGGAIQIAGAVKSNKIKKSATSDFMEIEKQRGISVATSVMGFDYRDLKINILDTPGHKDFAEDTYRTLTAVDSVIVVIDVAKGVEEQTEKLVEVCRMRRTPIIVFINKLDREGKDPVDLLDEVETKLHLHVCPLSWPVGMGQQFKGVYNMYEQKLALFRPHGKQEAEDTIEIHDLAQLLLNGDFQCVEAVLVFQTHQERLLRRLFEGVYLFAVFPESVADVRPGSLTGLAHKPDDLALFDTHARPDAFFESLHMEVLCLKDVVVFDLDEIAVKNVFVGNFYYPIARGKNGRAFGCAEIGAEMLF